MKKGKAVKIEKGECREGNRCKDHVFEHIPCYAMDPYDLYHEEYCVNTHIPRTLLERIKSGASLIICLSALMFIVYLSRCGL